MFLTLEDPNAKIKGSRDPLGAQPIWSLFGRRLIANLTTQTSSVRGFTLLLLGRYFGEQLIGDGRVSREAALDVALRMEQIGAYVRHVAYGVDGDIRGIERVRALLEENNGRVAIQADRRGYILRDQKVGGLWGLYSVAARVSGWLSPGPVGVEPVAREFVETHYLPLLNPVLKQLLPLLERGGVLNTRSKDAVFKAMAEVLPEELTPEERAFYGEFLRDGLHADSLPSKRQQCFSELLAAHTDLNGPLGRAEVLTLAEAARERDQGLSRRLERVASLEAVLAPAAAVFDYLLTQHGKTVDAVGLTLKEHWGGPVPNIDPQAFQELLPEVARGSTDTAVVTIDACQLALATGDYGAAVRALLNWNKAVMSARKAGPWAALDSSGRLDVRYQGSEQALPKQESLSTLWRNSYFIDSLKQITRQLEAGL